MWYTKKEYGIGLRLDDYCVSIGSISMFILMTGVMVYNGPSILLEIIFFIIGVAVGIFTIHIRKKK
jgi:hypothetical protein